MLKPCLLRTGCGVYGNGVYLSSSLCGYPNNMGLFFSYNMDPLFIFLALVGSLVLVVGFLYLSYVLKNETILQTEALQTTAEESSAQTTVMGKIAHRLSNLGKYSGKSRGQAILIEELGQDHSVIQIIRGKNVLLEPFIAALLNDGWTVLSSITEDSKYDDSELALICENPEGEKAVIVATISAFDSGRIQATKEGFDITPFETEEGYYDVTTTLQLAIKSDCDLECQTGLITSLRNLAKDVEVQIKMWSNKRPGAVKVLTFSPKSSQLMATNIEVAETPKGILDLSFFVHLKNATKQKVAVGKLVQGLMRQWKGDPLVEGSTGSQFNVALVGQKGTGKSTILKLLLKAAHDAGITVVNASAANFAAYAAEPANLEALRSLSPDKHTLLVIDEANGLPENLTAPLASLLAGLDSSQKLSVVLATNNEKDLSGEHTSNLFREGRMHMILDIAPLPVEQWQKLLEELKKFYPKYTWKAPTEESSKIPKTLGEVYAMGTPPAVASIFEEIAI